MTRYSCALPGHAVTVTADTPDAAADAVYETHGTFPYEVVEL